MHLRFKAFTVAIILLATRFVGLPFDTARAATITDFAIGLSSYTAKATGVTANFTGTIQTTSDLDSIDLRIATTSAGTTKPANFSVSGTSLTATTNLGSSWLLDTSAAANGLINIHRNTPINITNGTVFTITLTNFTLQAIDDCDSTPNGLVDTCFAQIVTKNNGTGVDTAYTSFTVTEDAFFEFKIEGVASGETHNGITSTVTSTPTTLPFGRLSPGDVSYATHKLTIKGNAPNGYSVKAKLDNLIHGSYNNAEISQFGAVNATWSTPQNWSTPDGTTPNNNTGWFGANTSDTRLASWVGASGKFGPFGTTSREIARSTTPDYSGTVVYVSYALGINSLQPADIYTGKILYTAQSNY